MQLNSTEISELIKQRIAQFNVVSEAHNEGTIVSVSDGAPGVEHCFGKGVIPTYQPDANCEYRRMLSRETHGGC